MSDVRSLPPTNPATAPVELFGHVWVRGDTPDGWEVAVAHLAARGIDLSVDPHIEEAS